MRLLILCVASLAVVGIGHRCPPEHSSLPAPVLRIEVTIGKGLLSHPTDGRLLVALDPSGGGEPRTRIGVAGPGAVPTFGVDLPGAVSGTAGVIDAGSLAFPMENLSELPAGDYRAQAVFDCNRDLRLPNAPENLISDVLAVHVEPKAGGVIRLTLDRKLPPETLPSDTADVKYMKLRSKILSRFHGRPIYLRAGVLLPRGFSDEPKRRYPLRVHIGGYGARFTSVRAFRSAAWLAPDAPRMVLLQLDGAGPLGDPYQVNSANNGPYGDAVVKELIPSVERRFRCIGRGYARVVDGGSTGGWVSLALQVLYPDFFNGCWSGYPDGVDFRAFQAVDIYSEKNAYTDSQGADRPSMRDVSGRTIFTMRHECAMENVLGARGSYTMSGGQWGAWNAVYGPRTPDGKPSSIWDPRTGEIDHGVAEQWRKYDLRAIMERDWKTLGPKLRGKLHIWVGEMDSYFLNLAVHKLDAFLGKTTAPPYDGWIRYGPGQGHGWEPLSEAEKLRQMQAAVDRGRARVARAARLTR